MVLIFYAVLIFFLLHTYLYYRKGYRIHEKGDSSDPVIVVNSFNASTRRERLIKQLSIKYDPSQIIVVIGGCDKRDLFHASTHIELHVTHMEIDYTAFVALLESKADIELMRPPIHAFLYLHDTCEVGPLFAEKLNSLFARKTIRATGFSTSCNIGIYAMSDIVTLKTFIQSVVSYPSTPKEIAAVKIDGFEIEDEIFNKLDTKDIMQHSLSFRGYDNYRAVLYVDSLDLFKYQGTGTTCPWGFIPLVKHHGFLRILRICIPRTLLI